MLLAMQQICLLRGDKSEQGRSFCFFFFRGYVCLEVTNLSRVEVFFFQSSLYYEF